MIEASAEESVTGRTLTLARSIAARHERSITIQPGDPLLTIGLDSLDIVNLMLAVEAEFDIMIPSTHLSPQHFQSVETISRMVDMVRATATH